MLFVIDWFSVKYELNYRILFRWDFYESVGLLAVSQYVSRKVLRQAIWIEVFLIFLLV
jgi:hypothetical protein